MEHWGFAFVSGFGLRISDLGPHRPAVVTRYAWRAAPVRACATHKPLIIRVIRVIRDSNCGHALLASSPGWWMVNSLETLGRNKAGAKPKPAWQLLALCCFGGCAPPSATSLREGKASLFEWARHAWRKPAKGSLGGSLGTPSGIPCVSRADSMGFAYSTGLPRRRL